MWCWAALRRTKIITITKRAIRIHCTFREQYEHSIASIYLRASCRSFNAGLECCGPTRTDSGHGPAKDYSHSSVVTRMMAFDKKHESGSSHGTRSLTSGCFGFSTKRIPITMAS